MFLIADAFNMIRQITAQGLLIGAWGALLNIPQAIGGLIFIRSIEGQTILLFSILTLMVAGQIFRRNPFTRLTGICHLPWLFMLPWLVHRVLEHDHGAYLNAWLIYVIIVVAISLIFDALDLYRYFKGDRTFSWKV